MVSNKNQNSGNSMKKLALLLAVGCLSLSSLTYADQTYRYYYNLNVDPTVKNGQENGDGGLEKWTNVGGIYGCSNWSPSATTIGNGLTFEQIATDCKQDQKSSKTGVVKTISVTQSREEIGTLENWLPFDPAYSNWTDTNMLYGCTSWTPDPSVYTVTTNFTQTSTTCKTDQERQRQEREQEKFSGETRDVGASVTEQQTLSNQSASRPYSVTLGNWTDVGQAYDCSNWSPDVSTIGKNITFTQTASDCKLDQTRTRTEGYKDHQSGSSVSVAKANENRTLTDQSDNRNATGTLEQWQATTPTYSAWTNTNELYDCTNWLPAPSHEPTTVTYQFMQTAMDCKTDQVRNRQDREKETNTGDIRDKGTPVVENQTLDAQVATRLYKVNLGIWTNIGNKYGCTNWSPAPSTVTIGQSFTQTATDCEQNQTRGRSEVYIDHRSGLGVVLTVPAENKTLTGQISTQTAIGTDISTATVTDLSYSAASIVADGVATSTLTATIKDTKGNPVGAGVNVHFNDDNKVLLSNFTAVTDANGMASVAVRGYIAGTGTVTVRATTATTMSKSLTLTANPATATVANLAYSVPTIMAGEVGTLTATITDANGNALGAGIPVYFGDDNKIVLQKYTANTDANGVAKVNFYGTIAGNSEITVSTSMPNSAKSKSITVTPDTYSVGVDTLTLNPTSVAYIMGSPSVATATIKDGYGNNVSAGVTVTFSASPAANVTLSSTTATTNASGVATISITGKVKPSATITASTNPMRSKSAILTITN